METVHAMPNGRFLEMKENFRRKKLPRANQDSNCQDRFSTTALSYLEEEENPSIFKMLFFGTDPSIFTSIKLKLFGRSNKPS